MSTLILVAVVLLIGWGVWYLEEHEDSRRMTQMVKADLRAKRMRGDIVKEVSTRGY